MLTTRAAHSKHSLLSVILSSTGCAGEAAKIETDRATSVVAAVPAAMAPATADCPTHCCCCCFCSRIWCRDHATAAPAGTVVLNLSCISVGPCSSHCCCAAVEWLKAQSLHLSRPLLVLLGDLALQSPGKRLACWAPEVHLQVQGLQYRKLAQLLSHLKSPGYMPRQLYPAHVHAAAMCLDLNVLRSTLGMLYLSGYLTVELGTVQFRALLAHGNTTQACSYLSM